jgi:ProQ/FINO family
MTDTTLVEAPARPRRTLTASPAMLAAAQRRRAAIEAPPAPVPKAKPEAPKPDPAPVAVAAPKADHKPRWRGRGVYDPAIDALLRERWPVAFCVPRPPLAVGIRDQILAAGLEVDAKALGLFLGWWVARSDYQDAICHGEPRRNLDGSPAGEPDEAQRRQAASQVYGARAEAVLRRIAERQAEAGRGGADNTGPRP